MLPAGLAARSAGRVASRAAMPRRCFVRRPLGVAAPARSARPPPAARRLAPPRRAACGGGERVELDAHRARQPRPHRASPRTSSSTRRLHGPGRRGADRLRRTRAADPHAAWSRTPRATTGAGDSCGSTPGKETGGIYAAAARHLHAVLRHPRPPRAAGMVAPTPSRSRPCEEDLRQQPEHGPQHERRDDRRCAPALVEPRCGPLPGLRPPRNAEGVGLEHGADQRG